MRAVAICRVSSEGFLKKIRGRVSHGRLWVLVRKMQENGLRVVFF